MLKLKCFLADAKISLQDFATDIGISKGAVVNLVNYDSFPKRINEEDFKKKVNATVNLKYKAELKKQKLTLQDLWSESSEENYISKGDIIEMRAVILKKATETFFKLRKAPFTLDINDDKEIYLSASHSYALEVMKASAEYGGLAVITGDVGAGKTTILQLFLEQNRKDEKYQIIMPESLERQKLNPTQILKSIVFELSDSRPRNGMEELSRQVKSLLVKKSSTKERIVMVIDEAHRLSNETIKMLKVLWEMKQGLSRLIGIILIGQDELETRLFGKANTEIREVTARTTHARLEPISKELSGYIQHRLKNVNADSSHIINKEAIDEISKKLTLLDRNNKAISLSYPLAINNYMNKLMNYCCDAGEKLITKEIVEVVI